MQILNYNMGFDSVVLAVTDNCLINFQLSQKGPRTRGWKVVMSNNQSTVWTSMFLKIL